MTEYLCLFVGKQLCIKELSDRETALPLLKDFAEKATLKEKLLTVSETADNRVFAAHCAANQDITLPTDYRLADLRPLFLSMKKQEFSWACMAAQLVHFDQHSRFCPACGAKTTFLANNARRCEQCNYELYPQIAPACIVLVRRGDDILMVRAKNFRSAHYGLVAGFLEIGETLEECVERELMEETGIRVKNLRYFGSQPWPFPSGLMVGFWADYESGELRIQEEELVDAQFFSIKKLPTLPGEMSIARQMIERYLESKRAE